MRCTHHSVTTYARSQRREPTPPNAALAEGSATRTGPGEAAPLVLIADPDEATRQARADALCHAGFTVIAPDSAAAVLDALSDPPPPAVVLLCADGPESGGEEIFRRISARSGAAPTITLRIAKTAELPDAEFADAWISPAASLQELVSYARVLVRLSRAERRCHELERQTFGSPPRDTAPPLPSRSDVNRATAEPAAESPRDTEGQRPFSGYIREALACESSRRLPCLYRRLVDLAPEAVAINFNDRLVYVNRGYAELLGADTADAILGRSPLEFIHPDYRPIVRERIRRILEYGEEAQVMEEQFIRIDGACVDVEVAAAPCETGRGRGVLVFVRDITRRKRAEEALRQRESELRLIMDSTPALISYVDGQGRYRRVNKSYQRLLGVAPEDVEGRSVREVLGEAAWEIVAPYIRRALAGERVECEEQIPYATGGNRWVSVSYTPDVDAFGTVRGFIAQVLDISARKAAEAELLESEQRFRQIAETIDHVFWMTELHPERVLYVSPAFQRIWDRPAEDLYRHPRLWLEAIHPEDRAAVEQAFQDWVSAPRSGHYDVEFRIVRPGGEIRWIRDRGSLIRNTLGEVHRLTGIGEDITERKQLERALRASEQFKQGVLDSLPAHIAVLDARGIIRAVNEPWRRFGCEHGGGCSEQHEVGADYLATCRRSAASGDVLARKALRGIESVLRGGRGRFSLEYPCRLGHDERWFLMHALRPAAEAGGVIVTHLDITAQKRVERALRHSQADLEQAQTIGQIGSWRIDLRRNTLRWSAENHRIFGIPRSKPMTYDTFLAAVHPDDREHVHREWCAALHGSCYDVEFRILVDGRMRWVRERAELEFDPDGQVRGAFGTTQDVTERKQAERQIAQLNQDLHRRIRELETILATAPIGLAIADDPEARRVRGNPAYQAMWGLATAAASSQPADHFQSCRVLQDGRELAPQELPLQVAARGHTVAGQILDMVPGDAPATTIYSSAAPLFDEDGQPRGAVGAFLDITPIKRAEQDLRASEERFRTMIQAVPSLTFEGDARGSNTFASESWSTFTGLSPAETMGQGWQRALHPEDAPRASQSWAAAIKSGTLYESRHRLRRADGAFRWFIARALPVRDAAGHIARWAGSVTDIDDLVQAEAALSVSEARMRQLLEALPQLVWTCEPNGCCDYLSPQWLSYTGLPEGAQLGRLWLRQVHRSDRRRAVRQWRESAAAGIMFESELRIRRADGVYHWFQSRAVPLRNTQNRIVKWLGTHSDIEALKRAVQALHEADRRKNEFLAMLSHELRNPLAPIRSATAVLRRLGPKTPELQAARDIIARQVDHLALLIDDLLDVSRIMHGQIALKKEILSIGDVVKQSIEASLPLIESRGHQLSVELPPQPIYLEGDPIRLVQVVTNLLRNAAKYTDEHGRLRITVESTDSSLVLRIADNGMGIPLELLPHVFEVFTQGPRALDRSQGGLGIGLSLARQLVDMHGGTIEAFSGGAGQGSEFVVRLPRLASIPMPSVSAPSSIPPPSPPQSEAKRVLVVDDNADAAQALAWMLILEGHQVLVASDGPAAIEMARSFRPHVVLLDIGLPGMDGFDVAKHLQQCPEAGGPVLVAITGYAETEMVRRSREAGFSRHLVKPVETAELLEVVARCAPEQPNGGSHPTSATLKPC